MTKGSTSGNSPAVPGTEVELLAWMQIFGLPVEASATFTSGADTILAIQFGDVSLGDVLTYLVSKAEPGLDFKLTPPWDLLNTINLHEFVFEVDLTNFRIGFSYDDLDVNIPLLSLDRIEVWYSPATKSRNKSVDLSLFGSFLGIDFSSGQGLTWDLLSQPAPSVPGQGPKVFDLRYLGIGQHVTLRDAASLATLEGVIEALEGSYAPVEPNDNPLASLPSLTFDASAGWLFGADFSLMDTVSLAAVFNDPVLYGLRLALQGSKAGDLAGLEFEILYRKVSDNLGVYHIELQLPDALRKRQLGEANITLPVIDLDIYTNGDFLVDLGFPYNLDFSKSFQLDVIVWAGPIPIPVSAAAGLYFGVLDGQTSTQVPAVSNGSFAPVIVAGFGITVGLGYELSIGPLDAGFFAGIIGILEGVLAWFHPNADPDSTSVYVKVSGTVGIQIHIWGTVNFAILQASLDIYAYATATVVIESYQAIQVAFEAGISISVSIRVVFFTITLSFSATIRESLTIGQSSPTPWVIAATPAQAQLPAAQQSAMRDIVRSSGRVVQASPAFARVLATGISWRDQTAPATKLTIGVYLQPMLTAGLEGDRPEGGSLGGPQAQLVATLFVADHGQLEGALAAANAEVPLAPGVTLTMPDGTTPLTRKSDGTQLITAATEPYDTFSSLADVCKEASDVFSLGYLARMVPGLLPQGPITPQGPVRLPDETLTLDGGSYTVTADDSLTSIAAQLLSPFEQLTREALLWAVESAQLSVQQAQAALGGAVTATDGTGPDTPVSASHLHALYAGLANPSDSVPPFSLPEVVAFLNNRGIAFDLRSMAAPFTPDNPSLTVFPMPPFLQLTANGNGVDTSTVDFGTGPYLADAHYQQDLAQYFQELAAPAPPPPSGAPGAQSAPDPAQPAPPPPAGAPATQAAVTGGPPESVAAVLFTDYFAFILRQVIQDALDLYGEYTYQVPDGSTDTLADIANRFGISDPDLVEPNLDVDGLLVAGQLITFADGGTVTTKAGDTFGNLADRSRYSVTDLAAAVGAQSGLLRPGAALTLIDGTRYTVADGDTLRTIATGRQAAVTDEVAVARITEANKTSTTFFAPGNQQLAINQLSTQVIGGETLRTLATRLQLTPLLVAMAIRGDTAVLTAGPTIQVSGGSYVVGESDTLGSIAAWLAPSPDKVAATLAAVAGAAAAVPGLLIPLTSLTLPGGKVYVVGPSDTLASIAAATGAALTDVATAAGDQLFAGVGFPLPTLPWTITDPATESLDAIAARFGTTLAAVVAGANADALLLHTGAPVVFGLTTQTQPADTLAKLAERFKVTTANLAAALRDQQGLLAQGQTVQVPPQASYVIKRGDTLASIAAAFGTTDQAIMNANPQVNCRPGQPCWSPMPGASLPRPGMGLSMPVGLRINLPPGLSCQLGSQDTLAGVAQTFGLSLAELVPAAAAVPLTPQASVVLPPTSYQVADGDTPLSIAAQFGLTVQQLVLANTGARFDKVIVPDAEFLPLSTLVSDLAQAGSFDKPAGSLARFLLHGLRLPSPDDTPPTDPADRQLYPMYTLTGQQLTPPTVLPDDYGLTVAPNSLSPRPRLTFPGGTGALTVPLSQADQTTLAGIAGQLTQNQPIDPGVLAATRYPPYAAVPCQYALGKPVPWQAASQPPLRYRYDPAGTGAGPTPAPRSGQPTLLPFPDALRQQIAASTAAAAAGPGLWVGLASGSKASPTAPTTTTPISGFGWATKIDFGLRQATDPNAPGQPLACIYQVFGVDQDATTDLQLLLDYCLEAGRGDELTLALAYPLSAASGSGPGLQSDLIDAAGVLLVKANLSTQSNLPVAPAAAAAEVRAMAAPQDSAGNMVTAATMSAADARHFLLLLWEGTVTNTGGYYLYYRVSADGPGLPAGIFNQDPSATVSLLITAFPDGDSRSTIPLRACHNAALVTDNLADPNATVFAVPPQLPLPDAATVTDLGLSLPALIKANVTTANLLAPGQQITVNGASRVVEPGDDILTVALDLGLDDDAVVQAIATGPDPRKYFNSNACVEVYPEWLTVSGMVQPGAAGFRLVRTNPDPSDQEAPRPAAGTPQDPEPQDPKTQLQLLFNLVGYQLIANAGFRASADGLPAGPARATSGPLNQELTAIAGVEPWIYEKQLRVDKFATSQPTAALDGQQDPYVGVASQARFGWQPQDVFGNRLLAPQYIDVDIGYTDDLVALSQWPSVITGYLFAGPPGAATVQVGIALDAGAYVATPGQVFAPVGPPGQASTPTGVAAQASAHQDRYATIFWQLSHDLAAEVTTTVDDQTPHPLDMGELTAFASGAWAYLGTVANSGQLTTATGTNDTLASIAATYNVSPAELAEANQSAAQNFAAVSLLEPGALVSVDKRYVVIQNDTLAGIAQQPPASADPTDPAGSAWLAVGNPALTLQPGTLLAVGRLQAVAAGDTLVGIAAAAGLDRTQLANANGPRTGLLATGTFFAARNYTVKAGDTLAAIAVVLNLTVGEAAAAADAAGAAALEADAQVVVPMPVRVTAGDSLAGVAARFGLSVAELGETNADADVLNVGAQIMLPDAGPVTIAAHDTLGSVAAAHGLAAGALASGVAGSTVLLRPGATLTAGYRPRAGDTLASVVAAFAEPPGLTPEDIAAANAQVPGLLAPGQSVLLGTVTYPVQSGDTFASLATTTGATVAALATANATATGLLAGGQTVAIPRHVVLPAGPSKGQDPPGTRRVAAGDTLDGIAGSTRQVTVLGSANSEVTSLLAPGVELSYPSPGGHSVTATTTPNDTLSTMAWRLQGQLDAAGSGQQVSVALLAEANKAVPCLATGALILLPPADVAFGAPVSASNPKVVFPLETQVTLRRTAHVDPALARAGASAVTSVTTPLAPAQPEGAAGQTLTLRQFAAAFETAFEDAFEDAFTAPLLKLATTSSGSSGTTDSGSSGTTDSGSSGSTDTGSSGTTDSGSSGTGTQQLFAVRCQTPALNYTILGDTLAGIAARFGLPVPALATAAAAVPGLLTPGVPIPLSGGGSYITGATDTLASIAAARHVTLESLAADAGPVPGLLVPGVTIPLPRYTVAAHDTLAGIAARFGLPVPALATAAAAVPGLLAAGVPIPLPGGSYTTGAADTLASIAAARHVTLESLAADAGPVPGLLLPTVTIPLPPYTVTAGTPCFFALRPLSTAVWSSPGPILISGYTSGQGLSPAQPTSFTGIDLDGWAAAFLAQLDLVLSSDYAVTAYTLDPASYNELVQAKATLAGAIRDSVDIVVEPGPQPPGPGSDLAAAQEALYQQLLVTLSAAYQVDTIVQLPASVTAPACWTGDTAPRLRGQPTAAPYTVRAGDTLSSLTAHFQAPLELLVTELAGYTHLLTPGFVVPAQVGQPSYTVTSAAGGDTLGAVTEHFSTAHLSVPITQLTDTTGHPLADTAGLLQAGVAVNLARRTCPLAADDTLFSAISYLGLDVATPAAPDAVADFAAMNATVPDLFAAGVTLQVPLPPVTVTAGDTIASLAARYGLTPLEVATAIAADTDVLTADFPFTLVGQTVTLLAGQSLNQIAATAHLSLEEVTPAVQSLTGLLARGATLVLIRSYLVQGGDTLTTIADEVGVPLPVLVTTQLHVAQVLQAGTSVAYLSRVPGFSLSSADLSLVNGEQNSLTFLFRTASSTAFSNLTVQLNYQVNQLEYAIEDVSWATGYQSSKWLTFLIPPPDDQVGMVDVPIPLRAYPVPPSVAGQTITPFTASHDAGPLTLQQLRRYDYDYTFSAQPAAQDTVSAGYLQNAVVADTTSAGARQGELPAALAQYTSIRAGLEQDLALLTRMNPVPPTAVPAGSQPVSGPAEQALRVFADLSGRVARTWRAWVAAKVSPSTAPDPTPSAVIGAVPQYAPRYQVRRGTLATGEATVQLLPDGDAAAVHADDIVVGLPGHVTADGSGHAAPDGSGQAAGQQVAFTPVAPPAAGGAQTSPGAGDFDLLVADRDVVTTQSIWGEVSITRNANLLAGRKTNDAFVYTVPEVKTIAPGVPLISWTDPFDLAGVPFSPSSAPPGAAAGTTRPLVDWLVNFFDALLNRYAVLSADTLGKIALRYDLTLPGLTAAVADVGGLLAAGAQLPLPDGTCHTVAACETLASVATANSVQVADLVQAVANASGLLTPGALIRPKAVCRNLRVAVDYSFPLATADPGTAGQQSEIVSQLPVLLYPMFLFDSGTDLLPGSGFCASLAEQLDAWAAARGLPPDYGRWVLDVSLYTTLPGGAGTPPLLELTDVRLDRFVVKPATPAMP